MSLSRPTRPTWREWHRQRLLISRTLAPPAPHRRSPSHRAPACRPSATTRGEPPTATRTRGRVGGMSSISVRLPRFEAITVAVRGSLGRRSSLENPIRASNASRAGSNPNTQANTPRESQPDRIVVRVVQVVEVDEKDKDNSRGAGQDGSEPATSNTDGTSQHQPKVRRDPTARTRHLRLRQRLLGHPGRYNLPRGVADRGDHRVRHHHVPAGAQQSERRTESTPEP